ncbi:MAG: hypothetical protein ACW98K_03810, partial [Candidatus Kariarchaeaceae archaeon]
MAIRPKTAKLSELIEDANTNFNNSRFIDAGRSFNHIAQVCLKQEYYEDAIYFFYRSIVANTRAEDREKSVSILRELGLSCLKVSSAFISNSMGEELDILTKSSMLDISQQNLHNLHDGEQRLIMVQSLVQLYQEIADDTNYSISVKEHSLTRAIELVNEVSDIRVNVHDLKLQLARILQHKVAQSNGFESEVAGAHELIRAGLIYLDTGDDKTFQNLVKQAIKMIEDLNERIRKENEERSDRRPEEEINFSKFKLPNLADKGEMKA